MSRNKTKNLSNNWLDELITYNFNRLFEQYLLTTEGRKKFTEKTGFANSTISNYSNGTKSIGKQVITNLCKIFNLHPSEFYIPKPDTNQDNQYAMMIKSILINFSQYDLLKNKTKFLKALNLFEDLLYVIVSGDEEAVTIIQNQLAYAKKKNQSIKEKGEKDKDGTASPALSPFQKNITKKEK